MMLRNMRKWIWQSTVSNSVPLVKKLGLSWPWSYGSRIYNYQCNQCLSPVMLWVRISTRARCTTLCDKVCPWLATGRWFSPSPPLSSTNKTDRHDIIEILLKVALNTIKQTSKKTFFPFINSPNKIPTSQEVMSYTFNYHFVPVILEILKWTA
jgi:hypothetical protein